MNRQMKRKKFILVRVYAFYRDGFKSMTLGKKLWTLILIKLFIMFAILKVFFFPNLLKKNFDNDADRGRHVGHELIERSE